MSTLTYCGLRVIAANDIGRRHEAGDKEKAHMRNMMTLKAIGSLCAALAIGTFSPVARGASGGQGTMSSVIVENGTQVARIVLNGGPFNSGRPSCHNAFLGDTWAFDVSTAKGKALLATATAALLAGKTVAASGATTGTSLCMNIAASGSTVINIEILQQLVLFN
jgi:hypothetical protein